MLPGHPVTPLGGYPPLQGAETWTRDIRNGVQRVRRNFQQAIWVCPPKQGSAAFAFLVCKGVAPGRARCARLQGPLVVHTRAGSGWRRKGEDGQVWVRARIIVQEPGGARADACVQIEAGCGRCVAVREWRWLSV